MSLYQRNYEGEHAPTQAPVPVNCLKPKVFIDETSIRQFRAPAEKVCGFAGGRRAEFACAKG
jgi:hypothetical protein